MEFLKLLKCKVEKKSLKEIHDIFHEVKSWIFSMIHFHTMHFTSVNNSIIRLNFVKKFILSVGAYIAEKTSRTISFHAELNPELELALTNMKKKNGDFFSNNTKRYLPTIVLIFYVTHYNEAS